MVTLHRREKLNEIEYWFKEINKLAKKHKDFNFILPIHPNPEVKKHVNLLTDVKVIDPLGHHEFIEYL